jgi:hypothetical protein
VIAAVQNNKILRRWVGVVSHRKHFHSDVDRSGRLDAKELQRALALGNLNFGLNDVVRILVP